MDRASIMVWFLALWLTASLVLSGVACKYAVQEDKLLGVNIFLEYLLFENLSFFFFFCNMFNSSKVAYPDLLME